MYGETLNKTIAKQLGKGLSPRVRGNPEPVGAAEGGAGSIPACTGKPRLYVAISTNTEVYPRVYGET